MRDLLLEILKPEHLLFYVFAYGLAATPTSSLVARLFYRIDIRQQAGFSHTASYLYKTVSKWSGVVVFVLDFLKGFIPCAIAQSLNVPVEILALIGLAAVVGHCFSMWLWFIGGHGGATMAGAMAIVFWPAALAIALTNWGIFLLGYNAGLASILASLVGLLVVFFALANKIVWLIVLAMVVAITVRHRSSMF